MEDFGFWEKQIGFVDMAYVKARRSESTEQLIKRFNRKVKKEKIVQEVRERRYFIKKSTIRRQKKLRRKKLAQRQQKDSSR